LNRPDVKEVPVEHLGAQRAQAVRAFVDGVNEGTNRNPAGQQHFGNMPAGLALPATRCAGHQNQLIRHDYSSFTHRGLIWYRVVSSRATIGTSWYRISKSMVPLSTKSRKNVVTAGSISKAPQETDAEPAVRQRILDAAFSSFMKKGYAATSTLEIASVARVSKRALYAEVGNKQEMLAACIGERAKRFRIPANLPEPRDRETLGRALTAFGTQLLRETSDPTVVAVFRLAIAEAIAAPEIAQAVDSIAGETTRAALRGIMHRAHACGLLGGRPGEMAERFASLLWGNLLLNLLLRVTDRPTPGEITRRAREATAAFLKLYPQPDQAETPHSVTER
jgi:AcrR family transcriptional regulator